jgi:excinuclease UvrABC nuclease subunit
MVVFVEGRAKKSDYRHFKIQYDKRPERLRDDAGDAAPAPALSAQ